MFGDDSEAQTAKHDSTRVGSVRSSAYERFQHNLLSGRIRPGQLISQRELVALLDVSLGALRELLPRLEAEGLLQVIPQRGIQITSIDIRMIRNAYQLRIALEREAVITAVETLPDEILEEQLRIHRDVLARGAATMSPTLLHEAQNIDANMHRVLMLNTGNAQMIRAFEIVGIRVRLINIDRMRLTASVLPKALGDHLRILDAIQHRNRANAVEAMELHIFDARNRAVEF